MLSWYQNHPTGQFGAGLQGDRNSPPSWPPASASADRPAPPPAPPPPPPPPPVPDEQPATGSLDKHTFFCRPASLPENTVIDPHTGNRESLQPVPGSHGS